MSEIKRKRTDKAVSESKETILRRDFLEQDEDWEAGSGEVAKVER